MPPTDLLLSQLRVASAVARVWRREVPAFRSFRARAAYGGGERDAALAPSTAPASTSSARRFA